ncbi:MAG: hypothetical protein ACFWTJ_01855 [Lachnoclostridium sp.]|jgi:RNA-directed DNA polymerase
MAVQSAELYAITTKQAEKNVRNLQRRLVKAATVRDTKLVKKLIRLMLHSYSCKVVAVEQVTRKNKGKNTAGVDGITITTDQERLIAVSRKYQRVRKYPVKRVYIPKKNGKQRPLGIPTVSERIQQKIHQLIMEPLYSVWGSRNSYGFRPGRCTRDCLEIMWLCTGTTQGKRILIDGDIQGCFDNISHDTLMELLDPYTLPVMKEQIWLSLKSGAIDKGVKINTNSGTPQGGVSSPLLANIALSILDTAMEKMINPRRKTKKQPLSGYVRFADDFVAILDNENHAEIVIGKIKDALIPLNLKLNMEKVKVVEIEDGLKFLGYHIRRYPTGKVHVGIPRESTKEIVTKIKDIFRKHRNNKQSTLIEELNPVINGWANYYRWTRAGKTYCKLDSWLWYKTWRWALRRHPKKSRKWIAHKYYRKIGNRKWVFTCEDENGKAIVLSLFCRKYSEIYPKLNRNKNYFIDETYFNQLKSRRSWKKEIKNNVA